MRHGKGCCQFCGEPVTQADAYEHWLYCLKNPGRLKRRKEANGGQTKPTT